MEVLQHCIQSSLQLHLHSNAIFHSERLYAESKSLSNLCILANCHFQAAQYKYVYNLLLSTQAQWKITDQYLNYQSPEYDALKSLSYLFSVCCCKLQKFKEAEECLESLMQLSLYSSNESRSLFQNESAIYYWMGIVYRYTGRVGKAVDFFKKASNLNPMMWCAFEQMCQVAGPNAAKDTEIYSSAKAEQCYHALNAGIPPSSQSTISHSITNTAVSNSTVSNNIASFSVSNGTVTSSAVTSNTVISSGHNNHGLGGFHTNSMNATPKPSTGTPFQRNHSHVNALSHASAASSAARHLNFSTPSPLGSLNINIGTPHSNKQSTLRNVSANNNPSVSVNAPGASHSSTPKTPTETPISITTRKKAPPNLKQNRQTNYHSSTHHHKNNGSSVISTERNSNINLNGNRVMPQNHISHNFLLSDVQYVFYILGCLGQAYRLMCQYRSNEAIQKFLSLPVQHLQSGWVLTSVGRCYFELADYKKAEKEFEKVCRLEPYRLEGLEIYSTALWHMRKEKQLSFLAQRMSLIDRLSPYTLLAIGNCFSLQRDHETALKFFERASKLNNLFVYAYTLAGHERFANDELEDAMKCFRTAIQLNRRHYNAWYGIGSIYRRQGKYEHAEHHFRKAVEINPQSSVLHSHLGMTLTDCKKYDHAIKEYDLAISLNSQNLMARLRKASTLFSMMQFQEQHHMRESACAALNELEILKECVPKESSVYLLAGKIYKKLQQKQNALHNFQIALNLQNPNKDDPVIKEEISKLISDCDEREGDDDREDSVTEDENEEDEEIDTSEFQFD